MRPLKSLVAVVAVVGLVLGLAACGSDSASVESTAETPAAQAAGSTVDIQLGEKGKTFFVTADKDTVPAGQTTFTINNVGTIHHEFAIFKTDLPADKLPVVEGKVDEEKAGLLEEAVYATPVRGDPDHRIREGRGANLTITLEPGKYVLLCNLAGHYQAGQFIPFTVT